MERRSRQEISDLLTRHDVSWRRDEVMSALTADADSEVWISDREVHLAFTQGALEAIAITSLTG